MASPKIQQLAIETLTVNVHKLDVHLIAAAHLSVQPDSPLILLISHCGYFVRGLLTSMALSSFSHLPLLALILNATRFIS